MKIMGKGSHMWYDYLYSKTINYYKPYEIPGKVFKSHMMLWVKNRAGHVKGLKS